MKSTFFEDLSYLADYFVSEENITNRKFTVTAEDEDAEDEPINQLKAIYQKGIDLALCNFEGNDNILIEEFIGKCQSKYLWMVIKQNLKAILKPRAELYEVDRANYDTERDFELALLSKFNK